MTTETDPQEGTTSIETFEVAHVPLVDVESSYPTIEAVESAKEGDHANRDN